MATTVWRSRLLGYRIANAFTKPFPLAVLGRRQWTARFNHNEAKSLNEHSRNQAGVTTKPSIPTSHPAELLEVCTDDTERWLEAQWTGHAATQYPYLWLRDNCTCPECFHPFVKARLILMPNLKLEAKPNNVKLSGAENSVEITWDDGHVSNFSASWLWERRFTKEAQTIRKGYVHRHSRIWGSEMQLSFRKFDFEQVLAEDSTLYEWLCTMEDHGFAMFKNTPRKQGQLKRLAEHVSFLRETSYGPNFQVKTSVKPSNLAYTSGNLGLHTDIPYDRHPPGVQFLHYIIQTSTTGGISQFADGFKAAEQLRHENPEAFRILCETPVDYIDVGTDVAGKFSKLQPQYTINLDHEGELFRVMYSNQCRDSFQRVTPKQAEKFLLALHQFDALLYRKGNIIEIKPEEGDVSCFYNNRVLHGRTSYEMMPGSERHLEGMYMDVDEVTSKRRVLEEELFGINAI